jgi:DNA invertase Pin-like site-specific DNA recombinase
MEQRRAAIYTRISEDREGAGLGVERQEADCRALAERLCWSIVATFSDNDVSAYSGRPRPGYRHLLGALRTGQADAVLVWHTDRLHRSPKELEEYIEVCQPREIPTQTVEAGPLDLATPSGRLMARQLGAYARFESEHHSDRAKRARLQAATDGRWIGGLRPFGYGPDGMTVIDSEAEAIRWMAAEVLAGRSLRSIAKKLNAEGTVTSTGKPWTARAVVWLLKRPRNAGLSQHQGEPIAKAKWPAILDEETWRGVCAVLGDPDRSTTTSRARKWLVSGLAVCGVCGEPVRSTVAAWGDRRVPSYVCPANHVRRQAEKLDEYVERIVVERLSRPDSRDLVAPDQTGDVAALLAQDAGLRARLDELGRLFGDGVIDALQLASGTARIRENREQVTAALAAANRDNVLVDVVEASDVAEAWNALDLSRKRAAIDVLLTVTILRTKRGGTLRRGESTFDHESVRIDWKR